MCLIAFHWHPSVSDGRRLIVVANRDEFFHRHTGRLQAWPNRPDILAAPDYTAPADPQGLPGTWMGVTRAGRFAALTNVRGPQERRIHATSRGELVTRFLAGNTPPAEYLLEVQSRAERYSGFNLLIGTVNDATPQLWWYSNRSKQAPLKLSSGVYGLSNASLDTPWPKVVKSVSRLAIAVAGDGNAETLFKLLSDAEPAATRALPRTGIPVQWEKLLSAVFVRGPRYGTRSSQVLCIDAHGQIDYRERSFNASDAETSLLAGEEVSLQF